MSTYLDADTLLAIDVGTVNTRANLFDVVDGRYRLIATGRAPSTAGPPLFDVTEGVRMSIERVQTITGRTLVDESDLLIMPVTGRGAGVDLFVATGSAGPKARTVILGLMPGVSRQSAVRLADSTYLEVIETIDLLDQRKEEEKIDAIIAARPSLILIAGGTDGGAQNSMLQLVDLASVAVGQMPATQRPRIIYAGNRSLSAMIGDRFDGGLDVAQAPNVRPSLEVEDLARARLALGEAIAETRARKIRGYDELEQWSGGRLMLTADAFGRVIRYLSRIYDPDKGVLGVDLGASHTMVAAAFEGDLRMRVETELGLGESLPTLLKRSNLSNVLRWMPRELGTGDLLDYIYNKSIAPATIPVDDLDLEIELALGRELIRVALQEARTQWPRGKNLRSSWLLPPVEPIIASGAVLGRAPTAGYAALALLDALQPTGITTLVLDPYGLSPSLGAAAGSMPMLAVHVLESGSFVSLGTVVSLVGKLRFGRRVLNLRLEVEGGSEDIAGEVKMGQLAVIPLHQGDHGKLTLRPERGIDVGFGGPGKAGALRVAGGAVGLIIDARGRPLEFSPDPSRQQEQNLKWLYDIGARK